LALGKEEQSYAQLEIDRRRFRADYAERCGAADSGTIFVFDAANNAADDFDNAASSSAHHHGSGG